MPDWPITLRRASVEDAAVAIRLIEQAADWLRHKGSDQWARPWPNRAGRDSRILAAAREGKTWIGWDNGVPAATITPDPEDDPYWPEEFLRDPAVYVHRLVVARPYKGAGLGAALLDWAGRTARREYGARWIRVSVDYERAPARVLPSTRLLRLRVSPGRRLSVRGSLPEANRADPGFRTGAVQGVLTAQRARVIVALPRTVSPS